MNELAFVYFTLPIKCSVWLSVDLCMADCGGSETMLSGDAAIIDCLEDLMVIDIVSG